MQKEIVILKKYEADEGLVFDWVDPHYHKEPKDPQNPDGEQIEIQDHLYAKKLFLGENDDITNYIEVEAPKEEAAANEDTE